MIHFDTYTYRKIEVVLVNISTLSTPTQMILAWTLVGILLTWLVIFAILAFRIHRVHEEEEWDELPTPAGSFPAVSVQIIQSQPALVPMGSLHASSMHVAVVSSHSGRVLPQTDHSD